MTRLTWETREYENGVDQGVFFGPDGAEAWNGLVSVAENTPDIRTRVVYIDGTKTVNQRAEDSFSGTIEAYTYPPALENKRLVFGLSYRVKTADSYKIHLVYNCVAHFSAHTYQMEQYDPFSIDFTTTPVSIFDSKPSAHLVVDAKAAAPDALARFEELLYGSAELNPTFPLPDDVLTIFDDNALVKVIDNGDGTFTIDGPDDLVDMLDATEFEAYSPVAVYVDTDTYTIRSF